MAKMAGKFGKWKKKSFKKNFKKRYMAQVASSAKKVKTTVPRVRVNMGLGFPKRMTMTHRYTLQGTITSTAGIINRFDVSCNNLYAPTSGGGSHQPLYFDQMAALYNHYTVIGSRLKVKVAPASSTQGAGFVTLMINDDTNAANIVDLEAATEQTQGQGGRLFAAGSNTTFTLTKKWSAKKTFGGSVLANDNLQGTSSSAPAEQSHYNIFYQDASGGTSSIIVIIEVSYIAVWEELKEVAKS